MKWRTAKQGRRQEQSHPARGAWIEISGPLLNFHLASGRTPRGVRGLKFLPTVLPHPSSRRTPRGARGLKYKVKVSYVHKIPLHPTRGAWIEIANPSPKNWPQNVAPCERGILSRNAPEEEWSGKISKTAADIRRFLDETGSSSIIRRRIPTIMASTGKSSVRG